jgi:DNA polymerase-3 subunit gamma/tau
MPSDFPALLALLEKRGKHQIAVQLHDQVGLVRYGPGELAVKPLKPLGVDWTRGIADVLKSVTGTRWEVTIADDGAQPSLLEQERMAEERVRADVLADPAVQSVLDAFPEAQLESFSKGA